MITATLWLDLVTLLVLAVLGVLHFRESRLASQRRLRAYVSQTSSEFTYATEPPYILLAAEHVLTNTGQTPAYELANVTFVAITGRRLEVTSPWFEPPGSPLGSRTTLGPGQTTALQNQFSEITPEDWDHILAGRLLLYACGQLDYRDAFGKRRRTRVCLEVRWDAEGQPTGTRAPTGNEAT